jgi:uncharacterized membrane protein YsdA (DUF1294 family)
MIILTTITWFMTSLLFDKVIYDEWRVGENILWTIPFVCGLVIARIYGQ